MAGQGPPDAASAVRRILEASHRNYAAAMMKGDAAELASHFTGNGILLPENSSALRGREAIEGWFLSWLPSTKVREFEVFIEEVTLVGETAYEVGRHRMVLQSGNRPPVTINGKFLMVYERGSDGTWRISRDMFNSNGPGGNV